MGEPLASGVDDALPDIADERDHVVPRGDRSAECGTCPDVLSALRVFQEFSWKNDLAAGHQSACRRQSDFYTLTRDIACRESSDRGFEATNTACARSLVHARASGLFTHQPMPSQGESSFREDLFPPSPGPDDRRFLVEPFGLFLSSEARELRVERMVGGKESLLAVQDRWVTGSTIIVFADTKRLQVDRHSFRKRRMRIGLEVRIGKVRDPRFGGMELDDVGSLDAANVAPRTALVKAKQRRQTIECALVNVDRRWRELPNSRLSCCLRYPTDIANGKQGDVGLFAGPSIGREDCTDVASNRKR